MIHLRSILAGAGALAVVATLAACAQVVNGTPGDTPASTTTAPPSTAPTTGRDASPASAGGPVTTPPATTHASTAGGLTSSELLQRLRAANLNVTTVHLHVGVTAGPETLSITADERLAKGKLVAASLVETAPDLGTIHMITLAGKQYIELPPADRPTSTPWDLVSAQSKSLQLRNLYGALQQTQQFESLNGVTTFVAATSDLRTVGPATIDGVATTRYALTIEIDKLPADFPNLSVIEQTGITTIPIQMWIDATGRVHRMTEAFSVDGIQATTVIDLTKFGVPVHIVAPPANEVGTG